MVPQYIGLLYEIHAAREALLNGKASPICLELRLRAHGKRRCFKLSAEADRSNARDAPFVLGQDALMPRPGPRAAAGADRGS